MNISGISYHFELDKPFQATLSHLVESVLFLRGGHNLVNTKQILEIQSSR